MFANGDRTPANSSLILNWANWRIPLVDIFFVAGFFVFSCDVIDKLLRPTGLDNLAYFGIYGLAATGLVLTGALGGLILRAPWLLILVTLPLISVVWSVDPKLTVTRGVELFGSSLFALLAGWHLTIHGLLHRLSLAFIMMVTGSFLLIFLVPSLGIAQDEAWGGTWIGLSLHKNGLGGSASLAVLIFSYLFLIERQRLWAFLCLLLGTILLAGSKSATSQLVTLIGLALASLILVWQLQPAIGRLLVFLLLLVLPFLIYAAVSYDIMGQTVALIGKDTTLGSRIGIWQLVWPYIEDRWWLGYGYGAFWQPDLPWVEQVAARLNFVPFYSHNGVVELWLGGGLALVIATALIYLNATIRALVPVLQDPKGLHHGLALVFMMTFSLRNMTEAAFLTRNDMAWVLFVTFAAALARDVTITVRQRTA